jgi:soluble lytic murein transglycosylase
MKAWAAELLRRPALRLFGYSTAAATTVGVFAWSCSAQQPAPSHGVQTPLANDGTPKPAPSAAIVAPSNARLSLQEFTPLLALPELSKAARALEAGDTLRAAREVESAMTKAPPPAGDVVRWQLLLARLREQAADLKGAGASYDLSSSVSWALQGYSLLGSGRVLVRQGRAAEALERLRRVPLDQPLAPEARLLIAEAAFNSGDKELAISTWRAHFETGPGQVERASVGLRLAQALLERAPGTKPTTEPNPDLLEALRVARHVALEAAEDATVAARARELEKRALDGLPAAERAKLARPTPEDELVRSQALLDARRYPDAEQAADSVLAGLPAARRFAGSPGCDAALFRAKAIAGQREYGRAADSLDDPIRGCRSDPDQRARILYLGGNYAASDGRNAQAVQRYELLEKELPKHTLADDARLRGALAHYELGNEARFTELLGRMQEDFPEGDMVIDGVFRLALRRIEKSDWAGAASVLDRAAALVTSRDGARGLELGGRERYFRARAWMATGEKERGTAELEAIVRELPLSYYMLHAYSRLIDVDPFRAKRARDEAIKLSSEQPFNFAHRSEFDQAGFVRAMELLRVGDFELARRELTELGLTKPSVAPAVLWGVALLYARAGSAKLSHGIARGLLTDWLGRWPAGDWSKAWELAFPRPYRALVEREAKKNKLDEALVYAIMREESAFDPEVVSRAEAYGLMQLIVPTARMFAKPVGLPWDKEALKRPTVNITLGCRALGRLASDFGADATLMAAGYNAGPGRPRRWLKDRPNLDADVWVELIPISETRNYVRRVLASRAVYSYLYEPARADLAMAIPVRVGK